MKKILSAVIIIISIATWGYADDINTGQMTQIKHDGVVTSSSAPLPVVIGDAPITNAVGQYVFNSAWVKQKGNSAGKAFVMNTSESPAHPLAYEGGGYSSTAQVFTEALTNQVVIAPVTGKTLRIYQISFFNRSATAGNINFCWTSGMTTYCYPAYCPANGGFGDMTYRVSGVGEGLYLAAPGACAVIIYYTQQ